MNPYVQLLYRALSSPLGIKVRHENPQSARAQFYSARKAHGDPALSLVSVTILDDDPNTIYLVRPVCPSESQPPSNEPTSGSLPTTSDGSTKPTDIPSE